MKTKIVKGFQPFLTNHAHRQSLRRQGPSSTHPGISYCFGNIPSPTIHREYLKDNTMIIHITNPEVNFMKAKVYIYYAWLLFHWLQNNLWAEHHCVYIPAQTQGLRVRSSLPSIKRGSSVTLTQDL